MFYFTKPGLRPNYTIIWIIINQEINIEEVKLQRKLYLKLIESPVKPSSNLGASSRNIVLLAPFYPVETNTIQWGSEYRASLVFKWLKVVRSLNGLLCECHLNTRLNLVRYSNAGLNTEIPFEYRTSEYQTSESLLFRCFRYSDVSVIQIPTVFKNCSFSLCSIFVKDCRLLPYIDFIFALNSGISSFKSKQPYHTKITAILETYVLVLLWS